MMARLILTAAVVLMVAGLFASGCLVINCPTGGKRNGKFELAESNIKPCVSCGPGNAGQCFGPGICCGPFGCLLGTQETVKCQREGMFHDREPCIAGSSFCRRNTGRCAAEGFCCNQEACYADLNCGSEDKRMQILDFGVQDLFPLANFPLKYRNEK